LVAACLDRLASLGRQGPRALAVLVLIGVALPPLGRLTRPWLAEAVFLLLTLSFLRADTARLRAHLGRPGVIAAATLWSAFGVPLLLYGAAELTGLREREPGLFLGLMLQGLASPMMAAPSLAALVGLDATLVLVTLVTGTALVPFAAPVLAQLLVRGRSGDSAPGARGAAGLDARRVHGAGVCPPPLRRPGGAGAAPRRGERDQHPGPARLRLRRHGRRGPMARADPVLFLGLAALAFSVFAALLLGTAFLFRRAGRIDALSLGVMASQRNMGLMVAAADGALPGAAWLYFSLCQFPIYLSPLLLRPLLGAGGRLPVG
jgi:BASS family bile acid:Na+ symporter